MNVEEILAEAKKLSTEEKMRLLEALGPEVCCAVMGELWGMHRMMRECMGAMPEGGMEAMMRTVMGNTSKREVPHG